jgi:putative ATPase
MKELGYGKNYQYSHNKPTDAQEFLPTEISGSPYYKPSNNTKENAFKEGLKNLWKEKYNY